MTLKKLPLRKCIGCQEMKEKKELVRIVKLSDESISIDTTGKVNGRGAYICPCIKCMELCKKSKALDRAFKKSISKDVYDNIYEGIAKIEAGR